MKRRILRVSAFCLCFLINGSLALAQQRVITFPLTDGAVSADPPLLVFAHGGKIGVNLAADLSRGTISLFTFSVDDSMVLDQYDLESDFGFQNSTSHRSTRLKAHDATGLIVVYGIHESGSQKFAAFRPDERGRLSKLWDVSYPRSDISMPDDVAFNEDGSKVYIIYNRAVPINGTNRQGLAMPGSAQPLYMQSCIPIGESHAVESISHALDVIIPSRAFATVVMMSADDGAALAARDLQDGGNLSTVWFDSTRQRLVAVAGSTVYLLELGTEELAIEATVHSPVGLNDGIGISEDGRFFLSYAGHNGTSNVLLSYNLDLETTSTLAITEAFAPFALDFIFNRASGTLLAPLSFPVTNDATKNDARTVNIVMLKTDGTLVHQTDAVLPKRSDGELNLIQFNNSAISASGALGFVSAGSDRAFAFDTLTGDIVNELRLPPNPENFIQVLDPPGLLVSSNGTNEIILTPLSVKPEITGIVVTKHLMTIQGANFLSGERVSIDGKDVDSAQRNPENPGHEIVLPLGKAHFPKGREFSIVVNNRDGLSSSPFAFRR